MVNIYQDDKMMERFLKEIAEDTYPKVIDGDYRYFFEYLFPYKIRSNQEIKTKIKKESKMEFTVENDERVSQLKTEVINDFINKYNREIIEDLEIELEINSPRRRGRPSKGESVFPKIHEWLWSYKYSRWFVDLQLSQLINEADRITDWIKVVSRDEVDSQQRIKGNKRRRYECIKLGTPSYLFVNFPKENGYFFLINRSECNRVLLCPSLGFAPNNQVEQEEIMLPENHAEYEDFIFEEVGKEEFLGIWLNQNIELEWLLKEEICICTPENMESLVDALKSNELEYQPFYRAFDVIE